MMPPRYLRFREQFAEVLDERTHSIEWLDAQVYSGLMACWGNDKACLLTSIKQFPTGAFEVHVEVAAGDLDTLRSEVIKDVEAWAAKIGALWTTIESRLAWMRLMKADGYHVHQVTLRKVA
ncbi:hypothetical protein [Sphingobium sp. TomTYG75]